MEPLIFPMAVKEHARNASSSQDSDATTSRALTCALLPCRFKTPLRGRGELTLLGGTARQEEGGEKPSYPLGWVAPFDCQKLTGCVAG